MEKCRGKGGCRTQMCKLSRGFIRRNPIIIDKVLIMDILSWWQP